MNSGKYVFAQLMSFLPKYEFQKCVDNYSSDYKTQWFTCRIHFWTMCFSQLTYQERLRDIENSLIALSGRLYHCGIPQPVPRSTLSDTNEIKDWRVYADFAGILAAEVRSLIGSFATDGIRFHELVIMGKESIKLVFRSTSCGQYPDNSTSAKFLNASLSRFILIMNIS